MMKPFNRKKVQVGIIFAVCAMPLLALQAQAGPPKAVSINLADTAITALQDNCDPNTGLPNPGDAACIGIEQTTGTASGGLNGNYVTAVNFAVLQDGSAPFTSIETITGTVPGRGTGTVTVLEVDNIDPSGAITGHWRVLKGTGSGALAGVTGRGTVTGVYDPNTGLASGTLSGVLRFQE